MYSSARAATVKCTSPGVIWGLDRVSYKRLVKGAHEDHADAMTELIKQARPHVTLCAPCDLPCDPNVTFHAMTELTKQVRHAAQRDPV
eukprot:2187916-Prymnesium_polylepis.2